MIYSNISIIYNPNSTGDSGKNAKKLKADLSELFPKMRIELHKTEYAGHAKELAHDLSLASTRPLIISSSGDGGYNEVINGALKAQAEGAKPICAVLASGNANDHSRTLQSDSLLSSIKNLKVQKIDMLKIEIKYNDDRQTRYAHSYIGFGLTPIVAEELNKTDLNPFKELWITLSTFYKYKPFKILHKGSVMKLDSIIFTSIGEMAKVLTLSKESKPDDGLFEVVIFRHASKLKLLRKLVKATVAGLDDPFSTKTYAFKVGKKTPAQLDGEVIKVPAGASITITCKPKALSTVL